MKRRLLFMICMLICSVFVTGNASAAISNYKDAPKESEWSYTAINYALTHNLLVGIDGYIRGDDPITRAQMMTIINRLQDITGDGKAAFSDVDANAWYAQEVANAHTYGLVKGVADGKMAPEAFINREEAFVIVARLIGCQQGDSNQLNRFEDGDQVSSWANKSIACLVQKGIVGGHLNRLHPKSIMTRNEFAALLQKAIPNVVYTEKDLQDIKQGTVLLKKPIDVVAKHIKGSLLLGAGLNDATLKVVRTKIEGAVMIRGGKDIQLKDNQLEEVYINAPKKTIHLVADEVKSLIAATPVVLEKGTYQYVTGENITLGAGAKVLQPGSVVKEQLPQALLAGSSQSSTECEPSLSSPATCQVGDATWYYAVVDQPTTQDVIVVDGKSLKTSKVTTDGKLVKALKEGKASDVYGLMPLNYAELYYGEVGDKTVENSFEIDNAKGANPAIVWGEEKEMDVVSSATQKHGYGGSHFWCYPDVMNYSIKDGQAHFNGLLNYPVRIDGQLYANASILYQVKKDNLPAVVSYVKKLAFISKSLSDVPFKFQTLDFTVEKDRFSTDVKRGEEKPMVVDRYKNLMTDGSLGKEVVVASAQKKVLKAAPAAMMYNYKHGQCVNMNLLSLTGEKIDKKANPGLYAEWVNYAHRIYAVCITNEQTGKKYFGKYYDDIWTEDGHAGWPQIAMRTGYPEGTGEKSHRWLDFTNEKGTYQICLKSFEHEDIVFDHVEIKALLSDEHGFTPTEISQVNGSFLDIEVVDQLPSAYQVQIDKVSKGKDSIDLNGIDYDKEKQVLSVPNTLPVGKYRIEISDAGEKYQPIVATFVVSAGLNAEDIVFDGERLDVQNDALLLKSYLKAMGQVKVSDKHVDCIRVIEGKELFFEDGRLNKDALYREKGKEPVPLFEPQHAYSLTIKVDGYPEKIFDYGSSPRTGEGVFRAEGGDIAQPFDVRVFISLDQDGQILSLENKTNVEEIRKEDKLYWRMAQPFFKKLQACRSIDEVQQLKTSYDPNKLADENPLAADAVAGATINCNAFKEATIRAYEKVLN